MGRCASLITMTPSGRVRAYPLTSMSDVVVIGGCLFLWWSGPGWLARCAPSGGVPSDGRLGRRLFR